MIRQVYCNGIADPILRNTLACMLVENSNSSNACERWTTSFPTDSAKWPTQPSPVYRKWIFISFHECCCISPAVCSDCRLPSNFINGHMLPTWILFCFWPHSQAADIVKHHQCRFARYCRSHAQK